MEKQVLDTILLQPAFHQPNVWDYENFQTLMAHVLEEEHVQQLEKLTEEIRSVILKKGGMKSKLLVLNDIRHLGLEYPFQNEIKDLLSAISTSGSLSYFENDLSATALAFRLLRSHGFHVSEDVFDGFRDEHGDYKSIYYEDVDSLLSLYEASYLSFEGEMNLEDARNFTVKRLDDIKLQIEPNLQEKVTNALVCPLHLRPTRIEARRYIDEYEKSEKMIPTLLLLAKISFNLVQNLHQQELKTAIRWWKEQDNMKKLTFARDRMIESFYIAVGCVAEPRFGFAREELTKVVQLITVVDDLYELPGILDELELITSAITRWDMNSMEELPEYMKIWCSTLVDNVNQVADRIKEEKQIDPLPYLRKAWADLVKVYLVEAKWRESGYKPTLDEYLEIGAISMGTHTMLLYQFLCSEVELTEEALECWNNYDGLILSLARIARLYNDFATHAEEEKRGDAQKFIQCYMNQYKVGEVDAHECIKKMMMESLKKVNEAAANCYPLPQWFGTSVIEYVRTLCSLYYFGDGFNTPDNEKKKEIKSLFLKPLSLGQN